MRKLGKIEFVLLCFFYGIYYRIHRILFGPEFRVGDLVEIRADLFKEEEFEIATITDWAYDWKCGNWMYYFKIGDKENSVGCGGTRFKSNYIKKHKL